MYQTPRFELSIHNDWRLWSYSLSCYCKSSLGCIETLTLNKVNSAPKLPIRLHCIPLCFCVVTKVFSVYFVQTKLYNIIFWFSMCVWYCIHLEKGFNQAKKGFQSFAEYEIPHSNVFIACRDIILHGINFWYVQWDCQYNIYPKEFPYHPSGAWASKPGVGYSLHFCQPFP